MQVLFETVGNTIKIVLVGDTEKRPGVRAKFLEQRGGKRQFDCGGEAPVTCPSFDVAPIP